MAEPTRPDEESTPRHSGFPEGPDSQTPYSNLKQLAGVIKNPVTPFRRAASAGPTPGSRRTPIAIRTPGTAARRSANRPLPARRVAPTTPHAIRALRERANAARTPGGNRRRSGRVQRETPRDTLRDLSRLLARNTRPIQPSPQVGVPTPQNPALEDVDDGPDPVAPRLSMPLGDLYDDNDSFHEAPPRRSLLPDLPDDYDAGTMNSLEFGRRALSEDPRMMFSARVSERFADLNELGINEASELEIDGPFITRRPAFGEADLLLETEEGAEDSTVDFRAMLGRRESRPSDISLGPFGNTDEMDEPTFRFTIPQRAQATVAPALVLDEVDEEDYEDTGLDVGAEMDITEGEAMGGIEVEAEESGDAAEAEGAAEEAMEDVEEEVEQDEDLQAYRGEASAIDRSLLADPPGAPILNKGVRKQRKVKNISKYGLEYPSFPAVTVKKLAMGLARSQGSSTKITKDTLNAIMQATEWFFEQVSDDLGSYAEHAGRKTIEERDVITLMKRQRQITENTTPFSLAQKMLPRELLQELRIPPAPKLKGNKRKKMETINEDEEE